MPMRDIQCQKSQEKSPLQCDDLILRWQATKGSKKWRIYYLGSQGIAYDVQSSQTAYLASGGDTIEDGEKISDCIC